MRLARAAAVAATLAAGFTAAPAAAPPAASSSMPAPASVIGWEPCADYKLATYEQIARYFQSLAAASKNRMRIVDMGPTVKGRTQIMAIITSEKNMRDIGTYKSIARSLALARDGDRPLTDDQARALAHRGKAVVWIDFGLHSSEVAPAQTAPLFAYNVVTGESAEMRAIRDNVVLLLVPNMNPDGTTLVADWYMQNVDKPWEMRLPELWHEYVGHDDNRDFYMMTQPETRNSARQLYVEWFPQIVYNHHQAGPAPSRIFVPPFDDPMNPNIPPLVVRGVNLAGDAMTHRLEREGKRGAVSRIAFDAWWNGGMRTAPYFHNMVGLLTEVSHPTPTPATNDPADFPKTFANGVSTSTPSMYYPSPYLGGEWHMRDSCDYMVTTSMAVLGLASDRREDWLYDIYQMGRDTIRANADETFIIPADRSGQWDAGTAVKLVNTLRLGGIDIERATDSFTAAGATYPAGTFLIRGAQPFEPYVKDLLTPQVYPDMRVSPGGAPKQPYDIAGWTLSYQMGVRVERVDQAVRVRTERVTVAPPPAARVPDTDAAAFALDPRANDSFIAVNRLLKAGDAVLRARSPLRVADGASNASASPGARASSDTDWPAGAFIVRAQTGTRARIADSARALGLSVTALPQVPADAAPIAAPRIGVYHAWGGNMDEGWTRWILEQFEFPYTRVFDEQIRAGGLNRLFDVILLPDSAYRQMVYGFGRGSMPDQYVGGMTERGVANLKTFVEAGGVLVAMDRAGELPVAAFGLPIRNVTANRRPAEFYIPGSILKLSVDPRQPLAWGMPSDVAAFFANSPAFSPADPSMRSAIVARYPDRNLLMSGWILGEPVIAGQAAVMDVPLGRGRLVLLGFRTQHRGQPHGTFKFLFNSLFLNSLESK